MRCAWSGFRLTPLLVLLLPTLAHSTADRTDHDIFCVESCSVALKKVWFGDTNRTEPHAAPRECYSNVPHLQSLYLCGGVYCGREAVDEGLAAVNQTCRDVVDRPLPSYDELIGNLTEEDIEGFPRFDVDGPSFEGPVKGPVLPTEGLVEIWIRTLAAQAYVHYYHRAYSWAMGLFWAAVVAIGVLARMVRSLEIRREESHLSPWGMWVKRIISTPASFGRRCAQDYGGWATVPPRLQSLIILLFIILNVGCSIHGYRIFEGHMYFASVTRQILRHVSDRTGIISFANFPLIWLFGMRNNVLLWLTGWDFGTYNNFHRWVARVATVQAVIHSIGYTALIFREGGWDYFAFWWTFWFWWAGQLATVLMCAILAFSVYWLRRQQYETFLLIHIGLSVLVLFTMLGHVSIFNGEYDVFVWVPVLIWAFDRVVRVARIAAFNPRFWKTTRAQVTFNPAADMIRLEVPFSSSMYRPRPGTFFYLSVLAGGDSNFWESHPFTVASTSNVGPEAVVNETTPLLEGGRCENTHVQAQQGAPTSDLGTEYMTFLIRPYDGFTSRLRDVAESQWPKPATVRMAVDGPYGRTLPLRRFHHVVFVVGGSGIVVPLSYIRQLTSSSPAGPPRVVHIHWSVRQRALAAEILQEPDLRRALTGSEKVRMNVYLTGGDDTVVAGGTCNDDVPDEGRVKWSYGRIDAASVVKEAVGEAADASLAVVACGPARMADDTRSATVEGMRDGKCRRIEYFEEGFQW